MYSDNPFRETEDRLYFAKALDRIREAQNKNIATFTNFLNPQRRATFLQTLTKKGIQARAYGGYQDAERMMLSFAPHIQAKTRYLTIYFPSHP